MKDRRERTRLLLTSYKDAVEATRDNKSERNTERGMPEHGELWWQGSYAELDDILEHMAANGMYLRRMRRCAWEAYITNDWHVFTTPLRNKRERRELAPCTTKNAIKVRLTLEPVTLHWAELGVSWITTKMPTNIHVPYHVSVRAGVDTNTAKLMARPGHRDRIRREEGVTM